MPDVPDLAPRNAVDDAEPLPAMFKGLDTDEAEASDGETYNYAEDEEIVKRIKAEIIPFLETIRTRREPLEQMWRQLHMVWTLQHEIQGYAGRSNVYMPAGKKGIETIVAQLVSGTFPSDDTFDATARAEEYASSTTLVKQVLHYRVDSAKVRTKAEAFYRQLSVTGNSPVKIWYAKDEVETTTRDREGKVTKKKKTVREGPQFDVLDIHNFYAFPEDANSLDDVTIIFEDITVPFGELNRKVEAGVYQAEAVKSLKGVRRENKTRASVNKLNAQGFSAPSEAPNVGMADITEVWLNFDPEAETADDEMNPRPFLMTICGGEVLRAVENPFWHKKPPYRLGRMGTEVGRLYGTGYAESIRELNILLNDQTNQSMDCGTYSLNPIIISNPNLLLGELKALEPGVHWTAMDINGAVRFERPPADLINTGSILTAQTQAWINDFIGAPPVLQGGSSPGRAFKTATGIGTAQRNATMPLQEVVRLCEADVWEPMIGLFHALDQQFMPDELLMALNGGKEVTRVKPGDLAGEWMYKWLASTQASNQALKGQQLMELLQLLSSPNIKQALEARGIQVDLVPLVRRMYEEVFGFRNVDSVLVKAPTGPALPPGQPGSPATSTMPGPGGTDPSNLPEGLADNPEFQGMRDDADAMAALLGNGNMPGGLTGEPQA